MHRSEDRGPLRDESDELHAPVPRTRRERRLMQSAAAGAPQTLDTSSAPAPVEQGSSSSSIAALFAGVQDELPDTQPTILTVCTGNICRSALAATVLAMRLSDIDVKVHSAGTHALVGQGMPDPARELAARNGVPAKRSAAHRGRLLTDELMLDADLVLTMTAQHSTDAVQLAPRRLHRTFTVREFSRLAASLDDAALLGSAHAASNPRSRLNALVQAVSDQRGIAPRAGGDEDVIDPYRRSAEVYAQSEAQLIPALAQVERVVRLAVRR